MNKDELIKLKEQLMKSTPASPVKRYGWFDSAGGTWECDYKTEYEIMSEINMPRTIKKFETLMEAYVKYLVSKKIDFEKIKICFHPDLYASEEYLDRCDETDDSELLPELKKDDVLYDVIPLYFWLKVYDSNGHSIDLGPKLDDDLNSMNKDIAGAVRYSEFVKLLEQLGYDISLKNFDEYFADACKECDGAEIIIDFAKEKNQNHTM